MKALKILLGAILIIISFLLGVGTLLSTLRSTLQTIGQFNNNVYTGMGYALGTVLVFIVFGLVVYFLGKIGFKLVQNKPLRKRKKLEIEEIGK